jgi:hypothetical protein
MTPNNLFPFLFTLLSLRKQNKNRANQNYSLHTGNIYDFHKIATDQNGNDSKVSLSFMGY